MAKHICNIGKDLRVARICELITLGYLTYEIISICSGEWGLSKRTVERYTQQIHQFLAKEVKEKDREMILIEYDRLINKYQLQGNDRYASLYRERRDKIQGLYQQKVDITSDGKPITEIRLIQIKSKDDLNES